MVSPAEKCFLPGRAGFLGFLVQRSRTNKCQHLCQMGAGWNFCAPHQHSSVERVGLTQSGTEWRSSLTWAEEIASCRLS